MKNKHKHAWRGIRAMAAMGLVLTLPVMAQDGEALYGPCIACHGADAGGNASLGAPALAGQLPMYLERQLHLFSQDLRGATAADSFGAQMQPFAKTLSADQMSALARYLGSLTPVAGAAVGDGDARRGASLYNGNCGACHGGRAEGNEALQAPRLAGLDRAYMTRQLAHYRGGLRGADPGDRLGRQMAMMAATLTDEASIEDVISHIETLSMTAADR